MVINPIKTKSMTIATRHKHQVSPLPLDLVLNGTKIDQVLEHRLLGITTRRVFLLSKLRYVVDIDTRKLLFNAHIKSHIDYASVVWDGCSDVLKNIKFSAQKCCKVNLSRYNPNYIYTYQKLKEMRIMSLQKQLEYNKGLFMYRVLNNEAPGYISNLYTHSLTLFQL